VILRVSGLFGACFRKEDGHCGQFNVVEVI
jgi:hypothetical protein